MIARAATLWWLLATAAWATPLPEGPWGALVAGVWDQELPGGLRLDRIVVQGHEVELPLRGPDGQTVARVLLRHPDDRGHRTASLAVAFQAPFSQARTPEQAAVHEALARVAQEVEARDPGDLGQQLSPPTASRWLDGELASYTLGPVAGLLFVAIVAQLARKRPVVTAAEVRANHLLPAALQCTIYAYWAVYVSRVGERFVDIAAQLAFAYAFEALVSVGRGRPWRPSFAPLPVVLSTNLFVWFNEPWLQVAAIAVALGSKELIQRDGAHVFNPSAIGVTAVALPTILFPSWFSWGVPTPDVEMNLPPNLAELILVVALVAQSRFPIAMIPLGALFSLRQLQRAGFGVPDPVWPPTLLILVLFATDPKTIPKTVPGRLLYGLIFGLAIGGLAEAFAAAHQPDPYAKVLPVPLLNLLAPRLDRAGEALLSAWRRLGAHTETAFALGAFVAVLSVHPPRPVTLLAGITLVALLRRRRTLGWRPLDPVTAALSPRANLLVVAVWFVVAAAGVTAAKPRSFQAMDHFQNDTPALVRPAAGFPRCDDNPAWCTSFSVPAELAAWWRHRS